MAYQTQYVYVTDPQGNQQVTQNRTASLGGFSRSSSSTTGPNGTVERKTQGYQSAPTGKGVPSFLGNRALIFGTWAVSMALVPMSRFQQARAAAGLARLVPRAGRERRPPVSCRVGESIVTTGART